MPAGIEAELAAMEALRQLLRDAKSCADLFLAAEMSFPAPLQRLLGGTASAAVQFSPPTTAVPQYTASLTQTEASPERQKQPIRRRDPKTLKVPDAPLPPPRPALAGTHWIYLRAKDASPRILTIAVIFQANHAGLYINAAAANRLVNKVRESRRDSAAAYNSLQRLRSDGDIDETDGISIKNTDLRGVIEDGWIWVPERLLGDQDRAAIRRRATELILRENGPLSTADVTKVLVRCTWLPPSLTKDASKADLTAMELDGRVRRLADKTWEVIAKD